MSEFIPLSVPSIRGNEWKYIKDCLDTGWVSSAGSYVKKFEEEICKYTGAKYSVASVNGTSALHIALMLAGVKKGEEVIVPTVTFIAPVNTIRYLDANPVFMDCDQYYNLDADKTLSFILKETYFKNGNTYNKRTDARISALMPVHVFGNAVNLYDLVDICIERNIKIIEDATESLGTFYSLDKFYGKHAGTLGDIGCLSFNGNKIITTGGGGMILTDHEEYARKARYLTTQAKDDDVHFIHNEIGYNYRLTNIQAAMGLAQLEMLPEYLNIKKNNYEIYKRKIDKIVGLHLADTPNYAKNNHWMYALHIEKAIYGRHKNILIQYLGDNNIQIRPIWFLNHKQKCYKKYQCYKLTNAKKLFESTVNLPCSTNLTKNEINYVVNKLKDFRNK